MNINYLYINKIIRLLIDIIFLDNNNMPIRTVFFQTRWLIYFEKYLINDVRMLKQKEKEVEPQEKWKKMVISTIQLKDIF
jgi:hypothetical protein